MIAVLATLSVLVLVLLPWALIQRSVIAELERDVERLTDANSELRHACSDLQEYSEAQQARLAELTDELKRFKEPRPRRPARFN